MGGGVRKLYRHSSNEGSVIEIDYWGSSMKLFVADAKYRAVALAYDTSPQSHGNPQLVGITEDYFNGSADNKGEALPYTKDDTWIQSTYAALRNDGTAKSNTDFLMESGTSEAAHHCRNQDIPGVGQLDMPNLYELIILYLESDNIDALDPTINSNRGKALGRAGSYGRFYFGNPPMGYVWSSTENSSHHAWLVSHDGGAIRSISGQQYDDSVVPVKELDV